MAWAGVGMMLMENASFFCFPFIIPLPGLFCNGGAACHLVVFLV